MSQEKVQGWGKPGYKKNQGNQGNQGGQGNQGNQGFNQGGQGFNQGGNQGFNQGGQGSNQGGQGWGNNQGFLQGVHDGYNQFGNQGGQGFNNNQGGQGSNQGGQGFNQGNQGFGYQPGNQGFNQGGQGFNQGGQGFNQGGQGFNQGGQGFNQGGQGFNQGGQGFNQGGNQGFNQGGQGFNNNQGGQGFNNNQGGQGFNNNQGGKGFNNNEGGKGFNNNQGGQGFNNNKGGDMANKFGPEETYVILSARDKGMALDVHNNQNKLVLRQKHGENNQRFRLKYQNGKFVILSPLGGTVEVPKGSTQNGAKIEVNKANNAVNEYWEISEVQGQSHAYYIKTFCGKSLDLYEGKTQQDTPIIQWDFHGKDNQIWYIVPKNNIHKYKGGGNNHNQSHQQQSHQQSLFDPHKQYIITSALNNHMALDVSQGTDMNMMILWDKHGQKNQRFKIKSNNHGKYFIVSFNGGTVQVPKNSKNNGTQIFVGKPNNTPNEQWQIVPVQGRKNAYYIKSFCGKCLDVSEGSTQQNTPIIQWDYHGNDNQIWFIKQA